MLNLWGRLVCAFGFLVLLTACRPAAAPTPMARAVPSATKPEQLAQTPLPGATSETGDPVQTLSPQELQEDFRILRITLEEAHPGLYLYAGEEARNAQFEALMEELDHQMTETEFYRLLAALVADIRDGHTTIWPSPQSAAYASDEDVTLPIRLRFIGRRAYVDETFLTDVDIVPGTEVLAINGLDMETIVIRTLPYVAQDGYGEAGKYSLLGRFFPLYYALFIDTSNNYAVQVRDPATGSKTTVELTGASAAALGEMLDEGNTAPENLQIEVMQEEAIAIMTIKSFGAPGIGEFFDSSFRQLGEMGIQDLVIDLRGNGGGDGEHGALLYAYLVDAPFRYLDHLGIALEAPPTYLEYTNKSEQEWLDLLAQVQQIDSGERVYPHWYGLDEMQENKPDNFSGNVTFLIDGGSGSSTSEFAAIAHYNKRGVFVGQETNGTYFGNNSGQMPVLTLPNSGISVVIPLFQFVMAVTPPIEGRGVMPDFPVERTAEDLAAGIDTEMLFALDLIRQSRQQKN